jgi:hypothetical protein
MKKLVTVLMLATTTSLTALTVASPAIAAPHRYQQEQSFQGRVVGEGHYDSNREMRIDSSDRASSPYAGGA